MSRNCGSLSVRQPLLGLYPPALSVEQAKHERTPLMLQVSLRCGVPLLLLVEYGLSVLAPKYIVPLKARA